MELLHDARGRTFPLEFNPRRIVSLVPSWTETLFAFDVGERIVGITDYCIHPGEALATKQRIGGTKNPRVAEILALEPDLVIANEEENRKSDVERIQAQGIPAFVTFARSVPEAISEMETLGRLVHAANVNALVQPIRETFQDIVRVPRAKSPRVAVLIWRDPWMTANGNTYMSNLVETCGGINIFGTRLRRFPLAADLGQARARATNDERDTRYPRVSLQEIADAQPDLILLTTEPFPFSEADVLAFDEFGLGSRVRIVDGALAAWQGVRMGKAMEYFADLLSVK